MSWGRRGKRKPADPVLLYIGLAGSARNSVNPFHRACPGHRRLEKQVHPMSTAKKPTVVPECTVSEPAIAMELSEVIAKLKEHETELKRLGVEHLYLFGS